MTVETRGEAIVAKLRASGFALSLDERKRLRVQPAAKLDAVSAAEIHENRAEVVAALIREAPTGADAWDALPAVKHSAEWIEAVNAVWMMAARITEHVKASDPVVYEPLRKARALIAELPNQPVPAIPEEWLDRLGDLLAQREANAVEMHALYTLYLDARLKWKRLTRMELAAAKRTYNTEERDLAHTMSALIGEIGPYDSQVEGVPEYPELNTALHEVTDAEQSGDMAWMTQAVRQVVRWCVEQRFNAREEWER